MSQFFESLRMRVETENESSHNKIESRDWEWDESFPWESQFQDQDESLAEVCSDDTCYKGETQETKVAHSAIFCSLCFNGLVHF